MNGGEKLDNREKKRLKSCLNRHSELFEKDWNYTQLVKILGLTRYSDREKRDRQLENLREYINFEVLENGKIRLLTDEVERNRVEVVEDSRNDGSDENDGRFMNVKAFYNEERGKNNKKPKIEFRSIVRTSVMGLLKDKLYESKEMVYRTGYEEIAGELGFYNPVYKMVRRRYIKATRIVNGIEGRPKSFFARQTKRVIEAINGSYTGYINRTLEGLEKGGYINFSIGYWGYKKNPYSGLSSFKMLTEEEERFCAVEGIEIVCRQMGLENYNKVKKLNKEEEFYRRLGELLEFRFGLTYVRKQMEITLTDKGREALSGISWGESERKWLNKQFFAGLKENGERYYNQHKEEKEDEGNFNLLLEVLVKREKMGDREELKSIRRALYDGLKNNK